MPAASPRFGRDQPPSRHSAHMSLDRLSCDICDRASATCGLVAQFGVEIVGELHRGAPHDMPAHLLSTRTSTRCRFPGLVWSKDIAIGELITPDRLSSRYRDVER